MPKKNFVFSGLLFLFLNLAKAQDYKESTLNIPIDKDSIYGTLLQPVHKTKPALVILIAGSGPTDRNGNSMMSRNNFLKFLAEGLSSKGIATYRYDKKTVTLLQKGHFKEEDIHFDQFVTEAKNVLNYFKTDNQYSKIYLAGHSQGSLVGMLAAQAGADGFISLAGAGSPIDQIIMEQLSKQIPQLEADYTKTIDALKKGEKDPDFNPLLQSIFRLSVQTFLIEWMQYKPQEEIKKLHIPVLIINGDKDMQVSENEAFLLHKAKPDSSIRIIKNMNHLFKEIKGGITENYASYNQPDIPVIPQVVTEIFGFIERTK